VEKKIVLEGEGGTLILEGIRVGGREDAGMIGKTVEVKEELAKQEWEG